METSLLSSKSSVTHRSPVQSLVSCDLSLSKYNTLNGIRASTVLNRNVMLYGAMNALDTKDTSSCWNSDQAPPNAPLEKQQIFQINFNRMVSVSRIAIMFQGGFVPMKCILSIRRSERRDFEPIDEGDFDMELEDCNELQEFGLPDDIDTKCDALKLTFGESSDFYGRVTIYRLQVWGYEEVESMR